MKAINVLIGNREGLLSDYVEGLVREACDKSIQARCGRTSWVEEFVRQGSATACGLRILVCNSLRASKTARSATTKDELKAIRALKSHSSAPVIALAPAEDRAHEELQLREAGVDCVLGLPFNPETLKSMILKLLRLPARPETQSFRRDFCWFWDGQPNGSRVSHAAD